MNNQLKNIAVLIDADNTPISLFNDILTRIKEFGQIGIKKIYGDWGSNHLKGWQSIILEHAIIPVHQFAYTKGKNATDISMVIDAMDLVLENTYDGFCLVSSDSDFTPLAARLRASKIKVLGFGKPNTPDSFQKSCDEFICFELKNNSSTSNLPNENDNSYSGQKNIPNGIKKLVQSSINKYLEPNGWVKIEVVAAHLNKENPSFNVKEYGFGKFLPFLSSISEVEIKKDENNYLCRWKNSSTPVTEKNVPSKIKQLVIETIVEHTDETGWAKIGPIGGGVKKKDSSFSPKNYGFAKLSSLLRSIEGVEVKIGNNMALCRYKNTLPSSEKESSNPQPLKQEKKKPKFNISQVIQGIMTLLKNSTHKKKWVSLSEIESHLNTLDAQFDSQNYGFPDLENLLKTLELQCLDIPKYSETSEKYYRKIPFLQLVEQLKKVAKRTDIDIRDHDGQIKACALGKYAHFHVHYGKYGFQSFSSFFDQVIAYEKRKQANAK